MLLPGAKYKRIACALCTQLELAPHICLWRTLVRAMPPQQSRPLMRFDACPAPLAAALLLTGAPMAELELVKPLAQWAVFSAHSGRMECGLLADCLAASGLSPEDAADAIAAAAAAAQLRSLAHSPLASTPHAPLASTPRAGALLPSLSPFQPPAAPVGQLERAPPPPPDGTGQRGATAVAVAVAMCAQGRLVANASCRRCVAPVALCEPPGLRAINGFAAGDVPLGHFLAAALPAPGRVRALNPL